MKASGVLAASVVVVLQLVPAAPSRAQDANPVADYFASWFDRVEKAQAGQPHWITPIVTVTPRLEQELRYDQIWQSRPHGQVLYSYGGGKGLELIPTENTELIFGIPAYQMRDHGSATDGYADWNLLFKLRLLSANEESGNYIVTAFLGLSVPTGSTHNTQDHAIFTPTIAFGKGWGDFDVQATLAASIPDDAVGTLGTPILANAALQYRLMRYFWPELELNYSYWPNGERQGQQQIFVTPGLVVGKLPLWRRLGATVGVGFQTAVSPHPAYHHSSIVSIRFPF